MSRALAVVFALVAGLIALEFTVRIDDWAQFGVPIDSPVVQMDDLVVRDSLGLHARAGTQYRQFRINQAGFRGEELPSHFSGRYVVTAGASETFGLYETPGKEWPRQLEDSLLACGANVRVLNAAFAGMSLPTVRQDFELRLSLFRPSVVIYYPTPMQYLEGDSVRASKPSALSPAPLSLFRSRAAPRFRGAFKRSTPEPILDLARQIYTSRVRKKDGLSPKTEVEPTRLASYLRDLEGLLGAYKAGGAEPVVVLHRNRFRETASDAAQRQLHAWERFHPSYTGAALVAFDSVAAGATRILAERLGVRVVDPLSRVRALGDTAFADFTHYTSEGSTEVAGAVMGVLHPLVCRPLG